MRKLQVAAVFLFIVFLGIGAWKASQRPLWDDEHYSLIRDTLGISYKTMLLGGIGEGNNSPLFYILQKAQCDLFSYHMPEDWAQEKCGGVHAVDQIFLRIQSVVFVSVALSALFYYFARRNSLLVGVYAVALTMTSTLFWDHWTEARPYAGWFALSTFQILFLLRLLENKADQLKNNLRCLVLVHLFLSLISSISIVQITVASIVLWIFQRPKWFWYLPLIIIPMGIMAYYYVHAPRYDFFFVNGPIELINANIPKDRLIIIFIPALILFFRSYRRDWKGYLENKFLVYLVLMLGAFGLVLLKLKWSQSGQRGFWISSRYFLSLLPAGIVGTVLFSVYWAHAFSAKVWKTGVVVFLAIFLVFRVYKTAPMIFKGLNNLLVRQEN